MDRASVDRPAGCAGSPPPSTRAGPLAPGLALIFDMDGVIVDSMPVHIEVWRSYLASLGVDATGIEGRMHGLKNDEIVLHFLGVSADGGRVAKTPASQHLEDHGAVKERLFRDMMREQVGERLVAGVGDFLERMRGVPMGLASNAERANIDFILDGAGLRSHFQVIVDPSEVRRGKPAPDLFLFSASKLGVAPRNCIVFEDSPAGVAAARAAGMRVVGLLTHARALENVDFSTRDFTEPGLQGWVAEQRAV